MDKLMNDRIDWEGLAEQLGLLTETGEQGSSEAAKGALELIIGEAALRASVDHYLAERPGSELARHVLARIKPGSAMTYCYELFRGADRLEDRRAAVELLRAVADRRALPWVAEFLADDDTHIQSWGIGVLDQLLWSNLIEPDEAEALLQEAEDHSNEAVKERVHFIREYLLERAQVEVPALALDDD